MSNNYSFTSGGPSYDLQSDSNALCSHLLDALIKNRGDLKKISDHLKIAAIVEQPS